MMNLWMLRCVAVNLLGPPKQPFCSPYGKQDVTRFDSQVKGSKPLSIVRNLPALVILGGSRQASLRTPPSKPIFVSLIMANLAPLPATNLTAPSWLSEVSQGALSISLKDVGGR